MISVHSQGKPFNITVTQVYAPTSNSEKAEVERFYEDLQDLELTPTKDFLFIIGVGEGQAFTLYVLYIFYLEKEMATHSSVLAWRIPWKEELEGL